MAVRFLDTNVLLRYFTRDDEDKAARALALLMRIEQGQERVETSLLVVFETVFTLQRAYRVPKLQIRDLLSPILRLRALHVPNKQLCLDALELFANNALSFADAFNAVYMRSRKIADIYKWDGDFDKVEGIARLEPGMDS